MAKSANAVNSVASATLNVANGAQFEMALNVIRTSFKGLEGGIKVACGFIDSAANYVQQQDMVKRTALAYMEGVNAHNRLLGRREIEEQSAIKAIRSAVMQYHGKYRLGADGKVMKRANGTSMMDYEWHRSENAAAEAKRVVRGTKTKRASRGKALKTGVKQPAPVAPLTFTANAWRSEIVGKVREMVETAAVVMMPSEKAQIDSLLAAFAASVAAIPVPKNAPEVVTQGRRIKKAAKAS